ncbi:MAG: DUF1427 family protein [Parcubacteria group bacterium]|nr:DUF1427 family protein [Parcubacteria group bacterium]
MPEVFKAFATGAIVGIIFSFFKLPIPAPPVLAGVVGIIGIFAGYVLVSYFYR